MAEMALAGFEGDRTIERHLHLQGEKISARSVRRFRQNPLGPREEGKTRRRKRAKEIPDLVDACAGQAASRDDVGRPRMARLLRALAEAFAEGIAADTLRQLDEGSVSEVEHARLRSRRAEQLAILHRRFRRIPPRHRPRYTSTERAEILALKHRFRLSNKTVAAWFLLDPDTLCDWNRDVDHPEERRRPLVEPIADLEAAVARVALPPVPRRLEGKVVDTLAALAVKAPARKRRTRRKREARNPAAGAAKPRRLPPIHARHPNHYWSSDLTTLQLARTFWLASVIDLYSRDVLAWDLFTRQPSGEDVTALFHGAVARYDKPKHFVSDRGGQFVGEALATTLSEHGVDHRRGAVGQHGSIAVIERLWRSTKECLDLKAVRPNVPAILRDRVGVVIDYYRTKRPHSAVGNATPNQVHRGESSRAHRATPAPRGWQGEPSPPPSFTIRHAFPAEKELPYLQRVA